MEEEYFKYDWDPRVGKDGQVNYFEVIINEGHSLTKSDRGKVSLVISKFYGNVYYRT